MIEVNSLQKYKTCPLPQLLPRRESDLIRANSDSAQLPRNASPTVGSEAVVMAMKEVLFREKDDELHRWRIILRNGISHSQMSCAFCFSLTIDAYAYANQKKKGTKKKEKKRDIERRRQIWWLRKDAFTMGISLLSHIRFLLEEKG